MAPKKNPTDPTATPTTDRESDENAPHQPDGKVDMMSMIGTARFTHHRRFVVEVEFNARVVGAQPINPQIMRSWLESIRRREEREFEAGKREEHSGITEEIILDQIKRASWTQQTQQTPDEVVEEKRAATRTTFFSNNKGMFLSTYCFKAGIRDIASTSGMTVERHGVKQTVQHWTQVWGCDARGKEYKPPYNTDLNFYRINAQGNEELVLQVDGTHERPGHFDDAKGNRVSILRAEDYIEPGVRIRFLLVTGKNLLGKRDSTTLSYADIATILEGMEGNGAGGSRRMGFGTFDVIRCEEV